MALERVMIMVKQEALDCISMLPDDVNWSDILYSLYVIQKITKGQQEVRDGKGMSIDAARRMLGIA